MGRIVDLKLFILIYILSFLFATKTLSKSVKKSKTTHSNENSDNAFVTMITGKGEGYVSGAITLAQSLIEVKSKLPRYVMVTPDVPESSRESLSKFYSVVDVKPIICNHVIMGNRKLTEAEYDIMGETFKKTIQTFSTTCTKFHVFKLTKFKKILFMDADTMVLHPIDQVFNISHGQVLSAAPDPFPPDTFNSGVMVITPSIDTYKELVRLNKVNGTLDGGDQGILNYRLCPDWHSDQNHVPRLTSIKQRDNDNKVTKCGRLPWLYNVWANNFEAFATIRFQYSFSEPIVAHFMGATKPWKALEYEYIKNYNINNMPQNVKGDIISQAKLHLKWREFYQKATGDKRITQNRILSQFISQ